MSADLFLSFSRGLYMVLFSICEPELCEAALAHQGFMRMTICTAWANQKRVY